MKNEVKMTEQEDDHGEQESEPDDYHRYHHYYCSDGQISDLPAWCSRPFCRRNTQSEPEDYCYSTEHETSSSICSDEEEQLECNRFCNSHWARSSSRHNEMPTVDEEEQKMTVLEEFKEGFWLIFFVALPMLARQLGSLVSRRLLSFWFVRSR